MKNRLITIAALIASTGLSFAASYTLNSGTGSTASGIQDTTGRTFRGGTTAGSAYTVGGGISAGPGVVAFGIFSTEDFTGFTAADFVTAFTVYGPTNTFAVTGTTGNRSVYSLAGTNIAVTATSFAGKSQYLFAGNGSTFANSTEFLVVKTPFLFNASDDSVATPIVQTVRPAGSTVLFGSVGALINPQTANTDASATPGWQMAAVVPEPSAALLGAIGALGLLRRRRI